MICWSSGPQSSKNGTNRTAQWSERDDDPLVQCETLTKSNYELAATDLWVFSQVQSETRMSSQVSPSAPVVPPPGPAATVLEFDLSSTSSVSRRKAEQSETQRNESRAKRSERQR